MLLSSQSHLDLGLRIDGFALAKQTHVEVEDPKNNDSNPDSLTYVTGVKGIFFCTNVIVALRLILSLSFLPSVSRLKSMLCRHIEPKYLHFCLQKNCLMAFVCI